MHVSNWEQNASYFNMISRPCSQVLLLHVHWSKGEDSGDEAANFAPNGVCGKEGKCLSGLPTEPPVPTRQRGLGTQKRARCAFCLLAVGTNAHEKKKWLPTLLTKEVLVIVFGLFEHIAKIHPCLLDSPSSVWEQVHMIEVYRQSLRNTSLFCYVIDNFHMKTLCSFNGGLAQSRLTCATIQWGM